ncbi:MAG: hypothetical protein H7338_03590 [Candidatus Sericytochromatia bacterium]|nr:hypothetical protein [Candidatus Sericytochromatia bacterium]
MKLLSYGLQAGDPWAKIEFSHDDVERLLLFLQTARGAEHVGDLRTQLAQIEHKLRIVAPPGPARRSPWKPLPFTGALQRPAKDDTPEQP